MSTARLSSMSFQTLSLLLERQRLRTLGKTAPASQLTTIQRNMEILREGVLDLERQYLAAASSTAGSHEASEMLKSAEQLRSQWQRAKRMLNEEGSDIDDLPPFVPPEEPKQPNSALAGTPFPYSSFDTPYRDEPSRTPSPPPFEPAEEMQTQRQMMEEQDTHLDTLSGSIRRQRELSENIGNELDVHTGLLEDLESGLDNTALRLGSARRKLETVGRGARDNCSTVTIGALIIILLVLIIVFKT